MAKSKKSHNFNALAERVSTVHVNFSTLPLLERAAAINATCFPTSRRIIRKSIVFQGEDEITDSTASRRMV